MREYFDTAYEAFCDLLCNLFSVVEYLAGLIFGFLVYITIPIWVIPYVIIKKVRERKDNGLQTV